MRCGMRGDISSIVKVGTAVSLGIFALRYAWRRLTDDSSSSKAVATKVPQKQKRDEEEDEDTIWIYFGSQSGTAEGFSEELVEEAKQYGVNAKLENLEDFDEDTFASHKCVVLVLATYGDGDPTDNAIEFFKWLQDQNVDGEPLSGMNFTVMGLGNRQYANFNWCGQVAEKSMLRLGANRIYETGLGDDDQNIEEDFEQWKENGLWPALQNAVGKESGGEKAEAGLETAEEVLAKLQLKAVIGDAKDAPTDPLVQVGGCDIFGKWYFSASIAPTSSCYELLQKPDPDAGKTTKHIDISVKSFPALQWRTADNLEVLVSNTEEDVAWFAQRLGVTQDLNKNVAFVRALGVDKATKRPFPSPCTVARALSVFCDLVSAPSKMPARRFASLAKDEADQTALLNVLEDRECYQCLTGDGSSRLTLREFFELYLPSAEIDFSTFVQLCPRQRSRPYTIASSSREDPSTIGICVSIVQEDLSNLATVLEDLAKRGHSPPRGAALLESRGQSARLFRGLCSAALCTRTEKGDKLWINARASTFRLPRRSVVPVIMIGAGTGMAPFRGFIREFRAEGGVRTKTILFFGCRRSDEDFLYKDELEEALEKKWLGELVTAFSREQEKKIYVQDRVRERGADMAQLLLKEGAYLYVCGSTSMGNSVRNELATALGSMDHVSRLQKEGRMVEELW